MKETCIVQKPNGTYTVRVVKAVKNPATGRREDIVRKKSKIRTLGEARNVRTELFKKIQDEYEARIRGISTVDQAIRQFLELRGKQFSPASYIGMKQNFERYLAPIKDVHVTKVTRSQVEDLLQVHANRVAPVTLDRVATNIRALFRFLMERGMLRENPAQFIKFGPKKSYDRQLKAMSQGEIKKLLSSCQSHPYFPIFFVAYHTGARAGELIELKFSDFDFENSTITIARSQCRRTRTIKPPKNGRARTFHVNSELLSLVKSLKLKSNGSEYLLPREKQFLRGESAKILRALQFDLGIQKTNFHSIRGSFITHLLLAGVPVTTVQHIVGHADLKTTQRYVRLCGSDLVGATDSLLKNSPIISTCDVATAVIPIRARVSSIGTALQDL